MVRRQRGEGSVSQRKDGLWVARIDLGYVNKKRRRRVLYAKTQAGAIRKLREARKQIDAGVTVTHGVKLENWLETWLTDVIAARVKPKTLATYRSYVHRYIVPAIGRVRLDKLTTLHVRDLHAYVLSQQDQRGRNLSPTTAGHAHRILGTALADAMRADLTHRNVAAIEQAPSVEGAQRRPLTLEEFARFMRAVQTDRLASRWLFGFLTGSRQGECLGLPWSLVDLDAGVVDLAMQLQRIPYKHDCGAKTGEAWPCGRKRADRCTHRALDVRPGFWHQPLDGNLAQQRPKTKGSTRVVPLPPVMVEALRLRHAEYLAERERYTVDHGLVWCRPDGRPIDGSADRAAWHAHLEAAGIAATDQHSMRHTTSTILLAQGVPEHVRMSILGHSEEATNRRYTHVDLSLQRQAMERLGAAYLAELG